MEPEAIAVSRVFEPQAARSFSMDRHYLVYALSGSLRLEAHGNRWTLPPARAALVRAGERVDVAVQSRVRSASVLFAPGMFKPPPLSVFETSPLARALIRECLGVSGPGDSYQRQLYRMLGAVVLRLAETPSPCRLPVPRSASLRKALDLTEARAGDAPDFAEIARATGQSERALARRFAEEMGMTWRQALRRIRIYRAVELLAEPDRGITEIALDVGYGSLSAFNAAFRDLIGATPTDYRRSFGPTEAFQGLSDANDPR